eukprot:3461409-Amphidinium_carterae.1
MCQIAKDDLKRLFGYMDSDGSGEVAYEEFVRSIQKAQSRDVRMQLLALMLHINEVTPMLKVWSMHRKSTVSFPRRRYKHV